jgi:hypothetical protein
VFAQLVFIALFIYNNNNQNKKTISWLLSMIYIKYPNIQREKKYEQGSCKGNQRRKTKGKGSQVIERKNNKFGVYNKSNNSKSC